MANKIIIIHGWTYTIAPWETTVGLLKQAGYDVLQLRVPGLTSESSEVWTVEGYVQWLHEQLEGEETPIVIGHSNGGRIALNYLQKYPESFAHLILLNSAGVYVDPKKQSRKRKLFRLLAKTFAPLARVPLLRKIVYRLLKSDYGRAPENMKQTLHNMLESDAQLDLSRVKQAKISILWGENDAVTPLGMARVFARELPHAKLATFRDWGHAPYITHPKELAQAITRSLGKGDIR